MTDRVVLVTNVTQYAGNPSALALAAAGFSVVGHDRSFGDASARERFAAEHPQLSVISEQDPAAMVEAVTAEHGAVDVLVSNDCWPSRPCPIDEAPLDEFRDTLEALLVMPFALSKAVAAQMKERREGRIILITSAGPIISPFPDLAMYHSARGGASALAVALCKELGPFNIPVNAVAPNFLQSELYYPPDIWENDPVCRDYLKGHVPMGRLGRPEELGELVAFLASGKCDFVSGQVIPFSGGWPGMPPWPGAEAAKRRASEPTWPATAAIEHDEENE